MVEIDRGVAAAAGCPCASRWTVSCRRDLVTGTELAPAVREPSPVRPAYLTSYKVGNTVAVAVMLQC